MSKAKYQIRQISGRDLTGESLYDVAKLYNEREISWLELAPLLNEADEKGEDLTKLPITYGQVRKLLTAYRFLKAQRMSYLTSDLRGVRIPIPSTICYVLTIYRWTKDPEEKKKVFTDILDGVLEGRLKETQIRLLAKKAKRSRGGKSPEPKEQKRGEVVQITTMDKAKGDPDSIAALESFLKGLNYMLDSVLERNSYTQVRSILGKQCLSLATRLNCIGDKEFYDLWKKRKEVHL